MTEVVLREPRGLFDDLIGSPSSGYGHDHKIEYCPEGIPVEQALFGILAAFAASFGVLYRALTQATMGRRRKRSEANNEEPETFVETLKTRVADVLWSGMIRFSLTLIIKALIAFSNAFSFLFLKVAVKERSVNV